MRWLMRQARRSIDFLGWIGRVVGETPDGRVCRIGPGTAWELACDRHPGPAQEAADRAMVREAIEWARGIRERRNDDARD